MDWRRDFNRFAQGREGAEPKLDNPVFQEFVLSKRRELKRRAGDDSRPEVRTGNRRHVQNVLRGIIGSFKDKSRPPLPVEVLTFHRGPSLLVDTLCPDRCKLWREMPQRLRQREVLSISLQNLSFIDNPAATLAAINSLLRAEATALEVRLHFDDQACLDVAPYLLLSMMWHDLVPIFTGGRITVELQKVIEAVRLRQALKMGRFKNLGAFNDVKAFPIHRRRAAGKSRSETRYLDPQTREKVQDNFVTSVNEWLGQASIDRELTAEGRGWIKMIIGEVLDNAERHSEPMNKDGDWSTAGFMARRINSEGDWRYHCSIAFISVGATIAESLQTSPPAVSAEIQKYLRQHKDKAPDEVLFTVMSVQDGITRVPESHENHRGGMGFQDVFDMVDELGGTQMAGCEPKMTIVSGSACIMLRRPYLKGVRAVGDRYAPRELWFNPGNVANEPPDGAHAFRLKQRFPGTVVALSFVLDPEYLDGADDGEDTAEQADG